MQRRNSTGFQGHRCEERRGALLGREGNAMMHDHAHSIEFTRPGE